MIKDGLNQIEYGLVWENLISANDVGIIAINENDGSSIVATHHYDVVANTHCTKYAIDGTIVWERTLLSPFGDSNFFRNISIDEQNNIYIVCSVWIWQSFAYPYGLAVYIVKISPSGEVLWDNIFRESENHFVSADHVDYENSGNLYIAGEITNAPEADLPMPYIARFDEVGELVWRTILPVPLVGGVDGMKINGDTINLISKANFQDGQLTLYKVLKENGELVDTLPIYYTEIGPNVFMGEAGSFYFTKLGQEYKVIKYGSDGVEQWTYAKPVQVPAPDGNDRIFNLVFDGNHNPVVNGLSRDSVLGVTWATVLLDNETGETIWEHYTDYGSSYSIMALSYSEEGVLSLIGLENNPAGSDTDAVIINIAENGELLNTIPYWGNTDNLQEQFIDLQYHQGNLYGVGAKTNQDSSWIFSFMMSPIIDKIKEPTDSPSFSVFPQPRKWKNPSYP